MPAGDPKSVLITGASSGIGAALAKLYAGPGIALALGGRNAERLAAVARDCASAGAAVDHAAIDVRDRRPMAAWIAAIDDRHPLDLVVANAGVAPETSGEEDLAGRVEAIFAVNVGGVANTVEPAIPRMTARRRGQIAIMSSLSAFRPMPGAPAYSASKAAVKSYGEALRPRLAPDGVGVTVICPGFVESRITAANRFSMPLLMDAPKAARIIAKGLARRRRRVAFPWQTYWPMLILGALPTPMSDLVFAKLPRKD